MAVSGIFSALSGMHAHRQILDTTAHNVSNQLTPGYRRQVVDLAPMSIGTGAQVFAGPGSRSLGVDVIDTRRVLDEMAEGRARRNVATSVDAATTYSGLVRLEDVFGEPSERGIASELDGFWVSWGDLADRADDPVARAEVLSRASLLADRFQQASDDLDSVEVDAQRRLATMATEINTMADQVAELNRAIASSPETPNALLDERDQLAASLATMAGADVRTTDRGQVSIAIGGRLLVGGGTTQAVRHDGANIVWDADGERVDPAASELAAIDRLIDETVPGTRAGLDAVVEQLVTEVNAVHVGGYGLDGTTGRNFFDPAGITASTIAISADVDGEPDHLAAGAPVLPGPVAPGAFDGRQAQLLSDLALDGSADAEYRSFVAGLGIDTNAAGRRADTAQQVADRSLDEAESVSGVSLDEEMAMMMAAQRGYEASARVLGVVDEMLQTVIGMIR